MRQLDERVWVASITWTHIEEQCPDCLGEARWRCILPSGEDLTIECPRCYPGGWDVSRGVIRERYEHVLAVTEQAITGIEMRPDKVEIRAGGYIYPECEVFSTRAEAEAFGASKLAETKAHMEREALERGRRKGRMTRKRSERTGSLETDGENPASSANYARSQVRKAVEEIQRWCDYAKRRGTDIAWPVPSVSAAEPKP